MTEQETFIRADQELRKAIDQIKDEQWDMPLPEDFPTNGDEKYTMRQILTYQAYDEAWIPDIMAGKSVSEVGENAFGGRFDNTLLGENPAADFGKLVDKAIAAVEAIEESDLDTRTVHYSYGDFPLREALWHAIVFRAMRAHDVAKAIGIDSDLPDDLVQAVWEIVEPHAEEWRAQGVFGPKIEVADDAKLQDRLLGITGRKPS